jgi:Tol biopolymer transport system component
VLDFGLAKAFAGDHEEANLSNSPTLSDMATQQGLILGTAAYMSPEQARGKPVDKRTDIWAFGCVLYEALTGQAAFQGEDVTEIFAAVVKSGVNLDLLPANIHPRVREVIIRCLQKEQKKRYGDIGEAQYEIEQVLADPSGVFAQPGVIAKHRKKIRVGLPGIIATAILCVIVGGMAVWQLKPTPPPEPKQVMRFDYDLPDGQQFSRSSTNLPLLAVSPDGSKLVYCTTKGLFLHSMNEWGARFIVGTDGNSIQPFFSPDGQWIGYWSGTDQKLKKVAVSGGVPVTLCNAAANGGFSWAPDNRILHGTGNNIEWVSADGGDWKQLIKQEGGLLGVPQMLPGGESIMYLNGGASPMKIMVQSLKSGEIKELLKGIYAQYVKTGHIVYGIENNLYAVPFDIATLEVKGGSIPLVEGVLNTTYFWQYAISDSGTLVYVPGTTGSLNQGTLVWVDRQGKEAPLGVEPKNYSDYFSISPDGTRVALSYTENGNADIWIWDIERKVPTRLTFDPALDTMPIWTPDSERIVFASIREGRNGIYWRASDGSGKDEKIALVSNRDFFPYSVSADGKTLFLMESGGKGAYNIGMLSIEGDHAPKLLLKEEYNELYPQISPDGKWLAYASDESGRAEIYVRPFPDVNGGQWQISESGGEFPLWSPDGKELYYRHPDAVMAVSVETDPAFKVGKRRSLFQNKYVGSFDVDHDGKRFLMLKRGGVAGAESTGEITPKIIIVANWFEELKQRVPKK